MNRENIISKLRKCGRDNYDGVIIEKYNGKYYIWDSAAMMYSYLNANAEQSSSYALEEFQYNQFRTYLEDNQIEYCTVTLEPPITKNSGIKLVHRLSSKPNKTASYKQPLHEVKIQSQTDSINIKNNRLLVINHFGEYGGLCLEQTVLIEKKINTEMYRLYDIDAKICCRILGREEKLVCILNKTDYYYFISKLKSENVNYFVYELEEKNYMPVFKKVSHYDAQVNQYSKLIDQLINPSKKVVSEELIKKQEEGAKLIDKQVKENMKTKERLKNSPPTTNPTIEDMRRARRRDFFKN